MVCKVLFPQWGTEIMVPSVENEELPKIDFFQPGLGQNIALDALPTVKNCA